MADIDDFDLDRSTAQAWDEFQGRLGEVLSMMDDSADLTIGTASVSESGGPWVRFSCPQANLLRAEAASNSALGDGFQLNAARLAAMEELGWQPPTTGRGSGNFTAEQPQDHSDALSEMAVGALRDVYGVQHPVFLAPDQLAEVLQTAPTVLENPTALAADDVVAVVPASRDHLDALIDQQLTEMFGYSPLRDADGDVAIRVGSTMLFLRTSADAREIVVFAAVVHDVAGRSRAAEVLNDLNVEARWVKFQLIRDRVFVTTSVLARPFVPAHLQQAVRIVSDVADGVDDELAAKLNGRTTFSGHED